MRPYNWVQWTGFVLVWVGLALVYAKIAAELGVTWLSPLRHSLLVFLPWIVGGLLVNSRREPVDEATAEVFASRRRVFLLLTLGGSVLVALALTLLKGA